MLLETPISWISAAQFNLGFQLNPGTIVLIYRKTPATPIVTFTPGNLDTTDLNVATRQSIFLAQEAVDQAEDNLSLIGGGNAYDAQGRVIRNVGEGALDNDAATLGQVRELVAIGGGGSGGTGSPDTPEQVLAKLLTVDGPGSGLQADFLDGQDGAYYLDAANLTGTVNPDRLPRANGTTKGASTLSDSVASTSDVTGGLAATPKAVKTAYDLAGSKQAPATTLAGYGITDTDTREQAAEAIQNLRGAQGGLAPLDENGLLPANIFPEGTGGGGGELGYTPEDVAKKNAPNGYAGIDGQSRINPAAVGFFPSPGVFVPLAARLGQEVTLTDGYVEGSNLTDFSDLIDTNLARAVAQGRPFIIPSGDFNVSRKISASNTGIFMHGMGKSQSALVWTSGAATTGLEFTSSNDLLRPDHMHFSDFMLLTQKAGVGTALKCSWQPTVNTVFNPADPTIFDRHSHRFLARDLSIRGAVRETQDGWLRGIDVLYPIDAFFERIHVAGYHSGLTNYTESGLYAGIPNGVGHPTGPFFNECFIQSVKTAIEAEGCEGCVVTQCQLVGVDNGIRFTDPLGRPLLMATNNHINAKTANIISNSASQIQIIGNSLYHVIGATGPGTGVSIGGVSQHAIISNNVFESAINSPQLFTGVVVYDCDHGVIDGNTFRSSSFPGNPQNMKGIVLGASARFFKVGNNNVFEDSLSGRNALISTIEDGGVGNFVPGTGARYGKSSGQSVSAEASITFQSIVNNVGTQPSMASGTFTVPETGSYVFSAGVNCVAASGGHIFTIKKNGTGQNAIAGETKSYDGATPISFCLTTPPTPCVKGDTIYVRFSSGSGTTVNVHPSTFFEFRRVA